MRLPTPSSAEAKETGEPKRKRPTSGNDARAIETTDILLLFAAQIRRFTSLQVSLGPSVSESRRLRQRPGAALATMPKARKMGRIMHQSCSDDREPFRPPLIRLESSMQATSRAIEEWLPDKDSNLD